MSLRAELRDPWGWLVAGITGGVGWATLGTLGGPVAAASGLGIGAAVLATKVLIGSARDDQDQSANPLPDRPRDRLPSPPNGSAQALLYDRARAAVAQLGDLAGRPGDQWIAEEISQVLTESRNVVKSTRELAGRVTLLDSSIQAARPSALSHEINTLNTNMNSTTDPTVLREQQRAMAALTAQSGSIQRMTLSRDALLAQLQASAVGLEGLAARSGELVALGPAASESEEANQLVSDMTSSLESVRAGVDEARAILRDL